MPCYCLLVMIVTQNHVIIRHIFVSLVTSITNRQKSKPGLFKPGLLITRKGFLRKNIVVVSFFSKLYANILNTYLNFKHEHLYLYMFSENSLSLYHYIWSDECTC